MFDGTRDAAGRGRAGLRDRIARLYGTGEMASGTDQSYHDYYAQDWHAAWARAHPGR